MSHDKVAFGNPSLLTFHEAYTSSARSCLEMGAGFLRCVFKILPFPVCAFYCLSEPCTHLCQYGNGYQ